METSNTLTKIAPDLVQAIAAIKGATKDAKNPHFRNDYATLESVIEASRDILAAHNLCALQALGEIVDGRLTCTTRLQHSSGEWMQSTFHMPIGKVDPQGTGSAATYARRYSLMAALGVAPVDDDGEAAQGRQQAANGHGEAEDRNGSGPASFGKDFWGCKDAGLSAFAAKKAGLDETHELMRHAIRETQTSHELREWIDANKADIAKMPKAWRIELRGDCEEHGRTFHAEAA